MFVFDICVWLARNICERHQHLVGSGTGSLEMVDKVGKRTCLFYHHHHHHYSWWRWERQKERRRKGGGGVREVQGDGWGQQRGRWTPAWGRRWPWRWAKRQEKWQRWASKLSSFIEYLNQWLSPLNFKWEPLLCCNRFNFSVSAGWSPGGQADSPPLSLWPDHGRRLWRSTTKVSDV